nr:MAG TPA: hypothetical protein [Microviridae sp.]
MQLHSQHVSCAYIIKRDRARSNRGGTIPLILLV